MDTSFRLFDLISIAVTVGVFVIGLMIRSSISDSKAELLARQVETKEALTEKYSETHTQLEVHIAKDEQLFKSSDKAMARVEGKLDQLLLKS